MYFAFEICSRRDDHSFHRIDTAESRLQSSYLSVFDNYAGYFRLFNKKSRLFFADIFHVIMIRDSVRLHAQTMNSGSFAFVEHTALYKAFVGGSSHFSAQSINLTHKMAFRCSSD